MHIRYPFLLAATTCALASAAYAQTSTKDGSFLDTTVWSTGIAPTTTTFTIANPNTVTASSGVAWNGDANNFSVFGTLNVNTGSTFTQTSTGRLNDASTTTSGVININGGNMTIGRITNSATAGSIGTVTTNISAGSMTVLTSGSSAANVFNLTGGKLNFGFGGLSTYIINVGAGGHMVYQNGINRWNVSNTWTGGRVTTNASNVSGSGLGTTSFNNFLTAFSSNAANVWDLSSNGSTKQTFSDSSNPVNIAPNKGTIEFDVYSATNDDSDQIVMSGTTASGQINFTSGVHFKINNVAVSNPANTAANFVGKSYQLLSYASGYASVAATVDDAVWTIGTDSYDVTFTNNLASNGTISVASISLISIPEPSTFALFGGVATAGLAVLRRRRYR